MLRAWCYLPIAPLEGNGVHSPSVHSVAITEALSRASQALDSRPVLGEYPGSGFHPVPLKATRVDIVLEAWQRLLSPGPQVKEVPATSAFAGRILHGQLRHCLFRSLPLQPMQDNSRARVLDASGFSIETGMTRHYLKDGRTPTINDETELEALCAEIASQHLATESPDSPNKPCCRFTYLTMTGEEVELCSRGRHILVA
ncbi:hypothetical protein P7K49_020288 [Saguinus oedipus]|uniref:Uncharacterized protein n=1 Tax=Saguinus oedipus TaxID=9490 RepID=A0ABQ9V0H3_SAGOE|nr:hypothetical protein P7K49_020288 [Saguinus oedipus]